MFLPGGERPNGSNRRQKGKEEGKSQGKRSEADLIHRFDFIIRDEANRK